MAVNDRSGEEFKIYKVKECKVFLRMHNGITSPES